MKQLLIYERAAPVSRQRHGDWSVKTGSDYGFARQVNSVPLMATEFPAAVGEYPIVFTGSGETVMPAVILGVQDQQNVFVDENGAWNAKYIPAFVRRYPFVFSSGDDGATFTLCIDEEYSGCNQEGRGERLFDSQGERTHYLENVLSFTREFQIQFRRTEAFCKRLSTLGLLEPMQAQFLLKSGRQVSLAGFMAVNRDKLKAVDPQQLSEMARTDELELVYTHLVSMRNFSGMVERVIEAPVTPPAGGNGGTTTH